MAGVGDVVRCAIHPGIGIARLGNSPVEWFIGPEVPGVIPDPPGGFKDLQGRVKRQVARFRIYGLDRNGCVVEELNSDRAQITWTVHLVNKKAAWYKYDLPLDLPEAIGPPRLEIGRRNPSYIGSSRQQLVIDPGARSISGRNRQGREYHFDTGTFLDVRVPLGELRTDENGHLLVFGGFGNSGTPFEGNLAATFANNDGWYDDVSDGPVTAQVVCEGKALEVAPAWAIVAPPSYAPGLASVVSLYDLAYDAYLKLHPDAAPAEVSFAHHIYPIFRRLDELQWVNLGFYLEYGWHSSGDFFEPSVLMKLADNSSEHNFLRFSVFKRFRNPNYLAADETALPPIYGDAMDIPARSPRQYLTVTATQYGWLDRWSRGDFVPDFPHDPPETPREIGELPIEHRPLALDEAALEACLGGPFHPGLEASWPVRIPSLYSGLCRLEVRRPENPEPDYGEVLTPSVALGEDGPLSCSGAGDITRWTGVPWQADLAGCRFGYRRNADPPLPSPYLPSFWPAQVPNHVLLSAAFEKVMDKQLSERERVFVFQERSNWMRNIDDNPWNPIKAIDECISHWSKFGFVIKTEGPADIPSLPASMHVEFGNQFPAKPEGERLTPEQQLEISPRANR
jgi:hypothetical protein